jgi:TRAP transporter 4TM/12TM fusion protein
VIVLSEINRNPQTDITLKEPVIDDILSRIESMDIDDVTPNGFGKNVGWIDSAFGLAALGLLLFTFWSAALFPMPAFAQRAAHLSFIVILCGFTSVSGIWKDSGGGQNGAVLQDRIINLVIIVSGLTAITYFAIHWRRLYTATMLPVDYLMAAIVIVITLEITRRSIGWTLVVIVALGVIYAVFGPYFPHAISHRGYTVQRVVSQIVVGTEGLFSSTLGIASTYVAAFVFFAGFLEAFGGLKLFMKLALSVSGGLVGGPAKIAVISSSFFSMLSGSTVANVVSTGSITIPLMKRMGYPRDWAGAVEACASTGGTFTPPIMGATAFILAEFVGVPYLEVMTAAIIPAFLYYVGIYSAVHYKSCKLNFKGLARDKLPKARDSLKKSAPLLLPVILLVYLLMRQYTAMTAALYSIVLLFAVACLVKETRPTVKRVLRASKSSAKAMIVVSSACASAGIFIAVLNLTGLGFKLSSLIVTLSGGNLLAALILTQITAVLLGMGLVTPAVYALLGVLVAPGLVRMGVMPIAAHMFVFFVSALAPITPPVALAAFAAAGIADADPFKVGIQSVKLAIVAFLLPYFFVFNPALLGYGSWTDILAPLATGVIGVYSLGFASQGYFRRNLAMWERIGCGIFAVMLVIPESVTDLIGVAGIAAFALYFAKTSGKSVAIAGD